MGSVSDEEKKNKPKLIEKKYKQRKKEKRSGRLSVTETTAEKHHTVLLTQRPILLGSETQIRQFLFLQRLTLF